MADRTLAVGSGNMNYREPGFRVTQETANLYGVGEVGLQCCRAASAEHGQFCIEVFKTCLVVHGAKILYLRHHDNSTLASYGLVLPGGADTGLLSFALLQVVGIL